jgi:hypothetical protein
MRYACPRCKGTDLRLEVSVVRELLQDANGNLQTIDIGGHEEWDRNSLMLCNACDETRAARFFEVPEHAPTPG